MYIVTFVQGQYVFIHDAILEYLLCGVNEVEGSALLETVAKLEQKHGDSKKTGFEEMFQRLEKLCPVLSREECTVATLKANSKKNRISDVYPCKWLSHRVMLCKILYVYKNRKNKAMNKWN